MRMIEGIGGNELQLVVVHTEMAKRSELFDNGEDRLRIGEIGVHRFECFHLLCEGGESVQLDCAQLRVVLKHQAFKCNVGKDLSRNVCHAGVGEKKTIETRGIFVVVDDQIGVRGQSNEDGAQIKRGVVNVFTDDGLLLGVVDVVVH